MHDALKLRIGSWIATPSLNLLERGMRSSRIEPRAMDVLVHLARHDGAVVSVDDIVASVWNGVAVSDSSVYLAIRQLRQALADGDKGTRYIETIPKRGYRLAVPIERVERVGPELIPAHEHAVSDEPVSREVARHWKSPALLAGVAATLVVVVAIVAATVTFRKNSRSVTMQSVAVLPFDNLSSDPEQEYFADGITLETLNTLSRVHDLRVTAPTSSFRFKEKGWNLQAVGEALGVEHVLQGSVRTAGDHVRITVQLSRARTGDRLWSETYERRLADIFSIQDDIARSVADALQVTLGIGAVGRAPGMTRDVSAYDEYLRGMSRNLDWRPESIPLAVAHLQRAVAIDPAFSIAWAGLSTVYSNGVYIVPDRAAEWRQRGTQALDHARALTPDAPHVLLETGIAEARRQHWTEAARAFERLQASYARYGLANQAWGPHGVLLLAVGRAREAIPALERARADDPLAPAFAGFLSAAYLADGNLAGTVAEIDRGLTLKGLETPLRKAALVAALTQHDQAGIAKRLDAMPDTPDARASRRLARLMEKPAEAAAEIRLLASSANPTEKAMLAQWAAFYHDPELSLQLLTEAAPHVSNLAFLWQPLLRDVRKLPAFKVFVHDLGLVEYWRANGWSDFCRPVSQEDFACE